MVFKIASFISVMHLSWKENKLTKSICNNLKRLLAENDSYASYEKTASQLNQFGINEGFTGRKRN